MNTGYKLITYRDTNVYSETYGETMVERVEDFDMCPTVYNSQFWFIDETGYAWASKDSKEKSYISDTDLEFDRFLDDYKERHNGDMSNFSFELHINDYLDNYDGSISLFSLFHNDYERRMTKFYAGNFNCFWMNWINRFLVTHIYMPNSRHIDSGLQNLTYIELIDFGENTTYIGRDVLKTSYPKEIVVRALTPPTMLGSIETLFTKLIYVPDESVELYKAATNWSKYAEYIKPLSEYEEK